MLNWMTTQPFSCHCPSSNFHDLLNCCQSLLSGLPASALVLLQNIPQTGRVIFSGCSIKICPYLFIHPPTALRIKSKLQAMACKALHDVANCSHLSSFMLGHTPSGPALPWHTGPSPVFKIHASSFLPQSIHTCCFLCYFSHHFILQNST